MPNYFADYDTVVHFISEETFEREHRSMPHGGFVIRSGRTGRTFRRGTSPNSTSGWNPTPNSPRACSWLMPVRPTVWRKRADGRKDGAGHRPRAAFPPKRRPRAPSCCKSIQAGASRFSVKQWRHCAPAVSSKGSKCGRTMAPLDSLMDAGRLKRSRRKFPPRGGVLYQLARAAVVGQGSKLYPAQRAAEILLRADLHGRVVGRISGENPSRPVSKRTAPSFQAAFPERRGGCGRSPRSSCGCAPP